ncbi:hypothetical protein HQ535_01035 [bacterium]|nr:hypothetical protein [bacterium]
MSTLGRRSRAPRKRRFAALALGVGVAIVLIAALVFSIAFGTRGIAEHADALHDSDEALRAATVVRSQTGLATHLTLLEEEFGFDAAEGVALSLSDAHKAMVDLSASLEGLSEGVDLSAEALAAGDSLVAVSSEIIAALEAGDLEGARAGAESTLDPAFRQFVSLLVVVRDGEAAAVAASNDIMGRIGDLTRFLVAFLVPTAVIMIYRELSKRQQKQSDLEVRLDAERNLGKARDEFVANASHELRTPLTSIFGLAHLLEEDELVLASETAPEMVGMIISEAHDLSRMVDDLLTTARLDAGALHYQFEDLAVLDEIQEVVEPMKRGGMDITIDCRPSVVRSDRLRIRQVLRNRLSNANKYGGPNLRLFGRLEAGWYEIRVEDNGDGIPDELKERLFQRYLHEGDMPLVLGSVGLGLSIVRALAEGMGGAVWYERTEDEWTAFVVRVPLSTSDQEETTPKYREPGKPHQRATTPGGVVEQPPVVVDIEAPDVMQPVPAPAPASRPAPMDQPAQQPAMAAPRRAAPSVPAPSVPAPATQAPQQVATHRAARQPVTVTQPTASPRPSPASHAAPQQAAAPNVAPSQPAQPPSQDPGYASPPSSPAPAARPNPVRSPGGSVTPMPTPVPTGPPAAAVPPDVDLTALAQQALRNHSSD